MKVVLLMWSSVCPPSAVVDGLARRLHHSGELVAALPLEPAPRVPFIAACFHLDCDSLDRALQIAAGLPADAVEVRVVLRAAVEEL